MPSSTSNSSRPKSAQKRLGWADQRMPEGEWRRTWLLAVLFFLIGILIVEYFGRSQGMHPSLRDGSGLWNSVRAQASSSGPKALAIVGSSRAQLGLSTDVMTREFPALTPVQLGINGTSSLIIAEQLASDPDFHGSILLEVNPIYFFFVDQDPTTSNGLARARLIGYEKRAAWEPIEHYFSRFFQERFVFGLPQLAPQSIVKQMLTGKASAPNIFHLRRDRWRQASYRELPKKQQEKLRKRQRKYYQSTGPALTTKQLDDLVARVQTIAQKLQQHGGQLALFRMPSSGDIWHKEQQRCPKSNCWDQLIKHVKLPHLHFADHPTLQQKPIPCPDESHLDHRDSERFTHLLLASVKAQGFFENMQP